MSDQSKQISIQAPEPFLSGLKSFLESDFNGLGGVDWQFLEPQNQESKADLTIFVDGVGQKITFSDLKLPEMILPVRFGCLVDMLHTWQKQAQNKAQTIQINGYTLDIKSRCLQQEGKSIQLTEKEADLLAFMASQPNRSATRDDLLEHVWDYAEGVDTHTIETHIYRLRQKIEKNPSEPQILVTQDGIYFLQD